MKPGSASRGRERAAPRQPGPAGERHSVALTPDDVRDERERGPAILNVSPAHLGLGALASLLEASQDGIVVVDEARRYLYANPAACKMLGYALEDLLGRDFLVNFPPRTHEAMVARFAANLAGQPGRYTSAILRPDSEEREIEYTNMRLVIGGRPCTASIVRDVTETRRLARAQAALAEIASSVALSGLLDTTLNALAASVVRATGTVACAVVLFEGDPPRIRMAGTHGLPEGYAAGIEAVLHAAARSPAPRGLSFEIAARIVEALRAPADPSNLQAVRQPLLVRDARRKFLDDPAYAPVHELLREAAWDTMAAVPLICRDRAVGALVGYYPQGGDPGESELVLLTAIADQAAVAAENARLLVEAQGKAALEERQRLARELHDSVSQAIYGIVLGARTARALLDKDPSQTREPLDYVLSLAEAALAEMRALIFELRPESLEAEGLIAALGKQAAALQARHGIAVHTALSDEPALPLEVKQALYRIAQEALHNTVKHARASRVDLRLDTGAEEVVLEVRDDGEGFDPSASFPGHLGLRSMRERVARLGGRLTIESAPGRGTSVRAHIPAPAARLSF